jgi:hypothetical protein
MKAVVVYYKAGIRLQGLRNSDKPVRIVGAPAEIRTENLPNTSQQRYRLSVLSLLRKR